MNEKDILKEVLKDEKWERESPSENNKTLIRLIEKAIRMEKERVVKECYRTLRHILEDKSKGKVKNRSYPIKKICLILYKLYGIRDQDIKEELGF